MKINRHLLKSIGFLTGLVLLLILISFFFRRRDNLYVYDSLSVNVKTADIQAEPDNSLEVLFFGDSESYASFYPQYLLSEYGYHSFVCGTAAQKICDSYAILKNAFETQSPKVIVMETNCLYRELKSKEDSPDIVMNCLADNLPVFAYHSDWKMAARKLLPKSRDVKRRKRKGFIVRKSVISYKGGKYMHKTEKQLAIDEEIASYLEQIAALCEEQNATLLLVSTPSPKNWNYKKHNGTKAWADSHGIDFVDLNLDDGINIDWQTDTKDGGDHLNISGAKKVTAFMGEYFRAHYPMTAP
ncbi:MAG: hypothetical protein NC124_06225 [Clostridium sp.]|nr:hypothetical protein [Clostridium sp.]